MFAAQGDLHDAAGYLDKSYLDIQRRAPLLFGASNERLKTVFTVCDLGDLRLARLYILLHAVDFFLKLGCNRIVMNINQRKAVIGAVRTNRLLLKKYKCLAQGNGPSSLVSFLNVVLNLKDDDAIKFITQEQPMIPGCFDKSVCVLDVVGVTYAGEKVIVEFQLRDDVFFRIRLEDYIAGMIEKSMGKNERYDLPRVYFLGLFDFEWFPDVSIGCLHYMEEICCGPNFFINVQKVLVEMGKFFLLADEGLFSSEHGDVVQWLRAIRSAVLKQALPEDLAHNPVFLQLQNDMKPDK